MSDLLLAAKARCPVSAIFPKRPSWPIRRHVRQRAPATGQALVEFALASLMFFTIIFGVLDFGRVIFQYSQLTNAVREGARVAKVDATNTGAIKAKVVAQGAGLGLTTGAVTVTYAGGTDLGGTVTVSASYQFNLITALFTGVTIPNYTSSASVVIE